MNVPVRIAADHPALAGHFPDHPIVPAAVLLDEVLYAIRRAHEAAAGAGGDATVIEGTAAVADADADADADGGWHVDAVKFHRPVRPGLQLQLQCQPASGGGYAFQLQAGGERYVSGTVSIGVHTLPHALPAQTDR